jgi:hypothetical protein
MYTVTGKEALRLLKRSGARRTILSSRGDRNRLIPKDLWECDWPQTKIPRFFRPIMLHLKSLSLTHKQLQAGTANQRHPLYSSESSQHISRIKKKEHQWQNKEQ